MSTLLLYVKFGRGLWWETLRLSGEGSEETHVLKIGTDLWSTGRS